MTDDRAQRRADENEADLFSNELQDRARNALREGASMEIVAADLRLPISAVRHYARQIDQERCRCAPATDWAAQFDATAVTKARHLAAIDCPPEEIEATTGLPTDVVNEIVRRAAIHRRRERRAASCVS